MINKARSAFLKKSAQKTFDLGARLAARTKPPRRKLFASFFQKRSAFL
jgi:hypothetical protein